MYETNTVCLYVNLWSVGSTIPSHQMTGGKAKYIWANRSLKNLALGMKL